MLLSTQAHAVVTRDITGVAYDDLNGNGVLDAGEPPLAGATITLSGPTARAPITTGANGSYLFSGLASGTYTVTVTPPAGYVSTNALPGTIPAGSSVKVDVATLQVNAVSVTTYKSNDFLMTRPVNICGTVYHEKVNVNGIAEAGEPGLPGIQLTLIGTTSAGTPIGPLTTTTGPGNGDYCFKDLPPGTYKVTETVPAKYSVSPGTSIILTVPATTPGATYDHKDYFLYCPHGSIGDYVWYDANADGIQDAGEPGIQGVVVNLYDSSMTLIGTQTTDISGHYMFEKLPAGTYTVIVDGTNLSAAGYTQTFDLNGPLDNSATVTLAPQQLIDTVDFGYTGTGSIGNFVWDDKNADGIQGDNEPGIPNAKVSLAVDINNDGIVDITLEDVTDADGKYLFEHLPAGRYQLTFTPEAGSGYLFTKALQGSDNTKDSDADQTTGVSLAFLLGASQNDDTRDAGLYRLATLTGKVYCDANGNKTYDNGEPGIPGVIVTLSNGSTATTDADGNYKFEGLVPGDYTVSSPSTADGKQLHTDSPLSVTLVSGEVSKDHNFGYIPGSISGKVYCDTDKSGDYDNGEPGLPGVIVTLTGTDSNGNPVNKTATTDNDGNYTFSDLPAGDYKISVPPTQDGKKLNTASPLSVTLAAGQDVKDQNFGYILGSIAGTVYCDTDKNSQFDNGEPGIEGVLVTLKGTDSNGNPVNKTATTDSNGNYTFSDLPAGDYTITVPDTADGKKLNTASPLTVKLAEGEDVTDKNFGYILGSISGTLYCDLNGNKSLDAGEPGIGGITVQLSGTDAKGNPVSKSAVTDGSGKYTFTDLTAGTYTITAPGIADNKQLNTTNPLTVGLNPGQDVTDKNFGYVTGSISGTVYCDLNGNKSLDAGEPGIGGVTVTLSGTDVNGNPVSKTAVTDGNGNYTFTDLIAGSYTVSAPPVADGKNLSTPSPLTVALAAGQKVTDKNFGYQQPALKGCIQGTVYCDDNNNKIQDSGEPGLKGVTVKLYDGNGVFLTSVVTDAYGHYQFKDLAAGTYKVQVPTTASGLKVYTYTDTTVVTAGQCTIKDFRYYGAKICGYAYCDANGNGCKDYCEPGLAGVTITLKDCYGKVIATATTDKYGYYCFDDCLPGGTYKVYAPSCFNGKKVITCSPLTVCVATGGASCNNNFGYDCNNACIKGCLYRDDNSNCYKDYCEKVLYGVTVKLYDENWCLVATTTTNCYGRYYFKNLCSGKYHVRVQDTCGTSKCNPYSDTVCLNAGQCYNKNFRYHSCYSYCTDSREDCRDYGDR